MNREYHPPRAKLRILLAAARQLGGRSLRAKHRKHLPPPPVELPYGFELGQEMRLWALPVGSVKLRYRHFELEDELKLTGDRFRVPTVMADTRITDWLPVYAWLIEHPEKTILVDSGESPDCGTRAYFGSAPWSTRFAYPRVGIFDSRREWDLDAQLARAGCALSEIDQAVFTHTHSDHVGNAGQLPRTTDILVNEAETRRLRGTGRLPHKILGSARLKFAQFRAADVPGFPRVHSITSDEAVLFVPTPGHTLGHSSVVIRLAERWLCIAGDAAFNDAQLTEDRVPGVTEQLDAALESYRSLRAFRDSAPATFLYSHDHANRLRLQAAFPALAPERIGAANRVTHRSDESVAHRLRRRR